MIRSTALVFTGIFCLTCFGCEKAPASVSELAAGKLRPIMDQGNCRGRSRCVVVYLGLPCNTCLGDQCGDTLPLLAYLHKRFEEKKQVGLAVVVDSPSASQAAEVSSETGVHVFVDKNNALRNALPIDKVPRWLVLDRDVRITAEFCCTAYRGAFEAIWPNLIGRLKLNQFVGE